MAIKKNYTKFSPRNRTGLLPVQTGPGGSRTVPFPSCSPTGPNCYRLLHDKHVYMEGSPATIQKCGSLLFVVMKEKEAMVFLGFLGRAVLMMMTIISIFGWNGVKGHRVLLDTDMGTDDIFALFYLLKLNPSQIDLKAVTISTNAWSDAGHAVNQVYDILYMMGRDDIAVGVGGEGGILPDSTIQPNVGGYLPMIDQGNGTAGYCRYRQAIPVGPEGRLDIDSNYGFRKSFLPQN